MIAAIIQVRMGSTRLPGKVMADLAGQPMLYHVVDRVKRCRSIDKIILATTFSPADDRIQRFAEKLSVPCFRGDEQDVLARYYGAGQAFGVEIVVRITSDNPLIDPRITDQVVQCHIEGKVDYTANSIEHTWPLGVDTEVFSFESLQRAYHEAKDPYEREHVTPYIRSHPDLFKLQNVAAEGIFRRPDLRLTVDTSEDLQLVREIYERLSKPGQVFHTEDVVELLDAQPELKSLNSHVQQTTARARQPAR